MDLSIHPVLFVIISSSNNNKAEINNTDSFGLN